MPDVHFSLSFRIVLLVGFGFAALLFSWYTYRTTIPPVSNALRRTLASLRATGLFLIILLCGEPILSLLTHTRERPAVAVLVDNSKSMTIKDAKGERSRQQKAVLQSPAVLGLHDVGDVRYALFDGKSRFLYDFALDSVNFSGERTDISSGFNSVKNESSKGNIQAVLLITDGNSTTGTNPLYAAEELGVPVFTIGIGDEAEQKDVLIRNIITNEITYAGNRVPVRVMVRSSGYTGERVEVTLREEGSPLDRKTLMLEQGASEYPVELSFAPDKEGTHKITVEVSALPGELTERNNKASVFIKVLKSKMHVALLAAGPSQDAAFVRRALQQDNNIELSTFVEKKDGQFYEGSVSPQTLLKFECLVLVGIPGASTSVSTVSAVLNASENGQPIFFLLSRTIDFVKLRALEPVLPFRVGEPSSNEFQVFATIPEGQRNNPLVKLANASNTVELWSKLAPIFRLQATFRSKPESEIIGLIRLQSTTLQEPLILSRNVNRKKSIAVLGYGVWRWEMLSDPGSGTEHILEEFLANSVRWLTTREDERRFKVKPSREFFAAQEAVDFSAQVYDENYQPVDDAQVSVSVSHRSEKRQLVLSPLGNGQYEGTFDQMEEGDYVYDSQASLNSKQVGEAHGSFAVGGMNAEFQDTRMNKQLLQQIAVRTGGKYHDPDSLSGLANEIARLSNFRPRELSRAQEFEVWNSPWIMAAAILLFALEWYLRKRNGML